MKMVQTAAILAFLASAGAAMADPSYTAVTVPNLPFGTATVGFGVNDLGYVVGQADSLNGLVGFVYHAGIIEELPLLPGGTEGQANAINSALTIVGQCRDAGGVSRAVKWTLDGDGLWQITDLGTFAPGGTGFGVATRINEAGQIVGYATAATGSSYHGFLLTGETRVDVGTLSYSGPLAYSQALGLNEAGDVSGFAYRVLGGPEHGLAYIGGRGSDITPNERFGLAQWFNITDDGTLGGYVSGSLTSGQFTPATYTSSGGIQLLPVLDGLEGGYGYDINNSGDVVGTNFYLDANPDNSIFKAFLWSGGVTYDLNVLVPGLAGVLTEARDISSNGFIVASASNGSAVLLFPSASCAADFNQDGDLNPDDLGDFITCYFGQPPCDGADFNRDTDVNPDDLGDFITTYFTGCV